MTGKFFEALNALTSACEKDDVEEFNPLFKKQIEHDPENAHQWSLFDALTFISFSPSSIHEPFSPMFQGGGKRSFLPQDLSQNDREFLEENIPAIQSADLLSRCSDVCWLVGRNPDFARTAVNAYLSSGRNLLDLDMWTNCAERFERALRLSAQLRDDDLVKVAEKEIVDVLTDIGGNDPSFLSCRLTELLLDFGLGDDDFLIGLHEKVIQIAQDQSDWRRARHYLRNISKVYQRSKDQKSREQVQIRIAETHVNMAEMADAMLAASEYERAIEAYRRIPGQKDKVDEIYERLRVVQKEALESFGTFQSPSIDLTDAVIAARSHVAGQEKDKALIRFALITRLTKKTDAIEQAKKLMDEFPLQSILGGYKVDREGRTISKRSPINFDGDNESQILERAFEHLDIEVGITVAGQIDPARMQVLFEHRFDLEDFVSLATNHPFIPEHHEMIFAKGLYAGMTGDFITASHLLIPQLENSLRYLLQKQGVEPSKMDRFGIQELMKMPELLRHETIIETLGNDIPFCLQGTLVEKSGPNTRNRLSHGVINDYEANSHISQYVWWIILHILILPIANQRAQKQRKEEEQ